MTAQLTEEELESIRKAHLSDALPSGWWFDGHHYVDFAGTQRSVWAATCPLGLVCPPDTCAQTHPHMDAFIEEYLRAENGRLAQAE